MKINNFPNMQNQGHSKIWKLLNFQKFLDQRLERQACNRSLLILSITEPEIDDD